MRARPLLRRWHRWFGILCGGWLMLLAVTGSAIAWYDEIDTLLNPELRRTAPAMGAPAPLDTVLANARAALPGFEPGYLILADSPGETHLFTGRQRRDEGPRAVQLFADPASGAILGWRESGAMLLDRKHLPDLLYGLHTDLLLGGWGVLIVGFIGLAWLIDHFLSLPLALPRLRAWREAFAIKGRPGSLRRLWDWHRAKGMWLWPIGFILALTGVTLTFPEESRDVVRVASPVGERLHDHMHAARPATNDVGLDAAVAAVRADRAAVHSIRPFPSVGLYAVRTRDPRDFDDLGRMWTYVDMASGRITARRHDNGETAGDAFFALQYPLHSGRIGGLAGKIVVTLAGLVVAWLCWTGFRLLFRRLGIGRSRDARRETGIVAPPAARRRS